MLKNQRMSKKRSKKKGHFLQEKKTESRTRNPAEGWREERMEAGGQGVLVVFY